MEAAFYVLLIIGIIAAVIIHTLWWDSLSEDEKRARAYEARTRSYGPIKPSTGVPALPR
jgi:hypothetical protein